MAASSRQGSRSQKTSASTNQERERSRARLLTLRVTANGEFPLARLHHLPKQRHLLGTKYLS